MCHNANKFKSSTNEEIWKQDYLDEVIRIYDNNGI